MDLVNSFQEWLLWGFVADGTMISTKSNPGYPSFPGYLQHFYSKWNSNQLSCIFICLV